MMNGQEKSPALDPKATITRTTTVVFIAALSSFTIFSEFSFSTFSSSRSVNEVDMRTEHGDKADDDSQCN